MNDSTGALRPFRVEPWLAGLRLQAAALRSDARLDVTFQLDDPASSVIIPAAGAAPQRRNDLWQSTCFEAFVAVAGEQSYWELNLTPSGDWALYRLEAYREGLRDEAAISGLGYAMRRDSQGLQLSFSLDLTPLIASDAVVELSLTAVLEQPQHGCSYWAWDHVGPEPDFHQRGSFRLIPKRK